MGGAGHVTLSSRGGNAFPEDNLGGFQGCIAEVFQGWQWKGISLYSSCGRKNTSPPSLALQESLSLTPPQTAEEQWEAFLLLALVLAGKGNRREIALTHHW